MSLDYLNDIDLEGVDGADVYNTPHIVRILNCKFKGRRAYLEFSPYQGVRVTSIDCFPWVIGMAKMPRYRISTVSGSVWIEELRVAFKRADSTADFLDKSVHFVLHVYDAVIEIVAWECKVLSPLKPKRRRRRRNG